MQTTLNIKNFRVFDENGASVKLSPITFLTGCNSSGKSSVVKGLLLLNSFLSQIKKDLEDNGKIELDKYKLDFSTYPNNTLGRFDRVVHRHEKLDASLIIFEYSVYSRYLSKDVYISLSFGKDKNDDLNNGYLKEIALYIGEDLLYRSGCIGGESCNLNLVKNDCIDFATTEFLVHNFCDLIGNYEIIGNVNKEDYENQKEKILEYLKSMGKERCIDIFDHVRYSNIERIIKDEKSAQVLLDAKEKDTLFYVPVMDVLSVVKASAFIETVSSIINKVDDSISILVEKILNAFETSGYQTFGEYFRAEENIYLENILKSTTLTTPRVVDYDDLSIRQDFLGSDPCMKTPFAIMGEDNSFRFLNEDEIKLENKKNDARQEKWKNTPLSFGMIYEFLMLLNSKYCKNRGLGEYYESVENSISGEVRYFHYSYKTLCAFMNNVIRECLLPEWVGTLEYVSSNRVDVKRLYSLEEDSNFSILLKRYFEGKRIYLGTPPYGRIESIRAYEVDCFMNKWVKAFGIGEKLSLDIDKEGLGVQIRLYKSNEEQGTLLADEGYGVTQLVSILLEIETAIINAKKRFNRRWYGLDFLSKQKNLSEIQTTTIALEEPEIHLHPRYQSMLVEMLKDAHDRFGIDFIVETHSEYLIRRTQVYVTQEGYKTNEECENNNPFRTYYFPKEGLPYSLGYRKDGKFVNDFGSGFFDEASDLLLQIL